MVIIQFADTTGAPDAGRGSTGPDMPLCPLLPRDSLVPKKKRLVPFVLLLQTVSLHTYKACTEFFFFCYVRNGIMLRRLRVCCEGICFDVANAACEVCNVALSCHVANVHKKCLIRKYYSATNGWTRLAFSRDPTGGRRRIGETIP